MKTNSTPLRRAPHRFLVRSAKLLAASLCAAAAGCLFHSTALAEAGDLYVTDLATGSIFKFAPDGTKTTFATGLINPQGIAFDQEKNLYVATGFGRVLKYDLSGNKTIFYPSSGLPLLNNPIGLALDGSDLLVSENGADQIVRLPLDGVPPRSVFAAVTGPLGIASHSFDQAGFTRFVAHDDSLFEIFPDLTTSDIPLGAPTNAPAAIIRTLSDGTTEQDIFISTSAGTILEIKNGGAATTFASGLGDPNGMDFRPARFSGDTDRVGNLYVADKTAGTILEFTPDGTKTTFATGVGTPNFLAFEVRTASPVLLQNISTRAQVLADPNELIGGFIVSGGTPGTTKQVAIRSLGPSLANAGVSGELSDPILELHSTDADGNDVVVATNDNWKTNSPANQTIITDAGLDQYSGATISDSESIIIADVATLDPATANSGMYTAVVRGVDGATGVGLVEVYDLDNSATTQSELANISTRGLVGTGDNVLIGGIIVGPDGNAGEVVLRAIGPSLSGTVSGALQDPTLELLDANANRIAFNDNWASDPSAGRITALGLAPTQDAESALDSTLSAGAYTAIVRGAGDTTGVALVELYHVSAPAAK